VAHTVTEGRWRARFSQFLLLLMLAIAWVLWSGVFKPVTLGLGVFSCVLIVYLARRMGYFDNQFFALRFRPQLISYLAWLTREVVVSSLDVARIVLDPRLPISPRVVEVEARAQHPVDQVILGNSITLTPGTLTLDVHNGILKVHCLTEEGAQALIAGEMNHRVAALRGD